MDVITYQTFEHHHTSVLHSKSHLGTVDLNVNSNFLQSVLEDHIDGLVQERRMGSAKSVLSAAWFDKFLAHGQAHMGQMGQ